MTLSLRQFAYFVALMIMFGWLLHVGKPVLLPVLIAMIALYILSNVTDRLGAMPLIGRERLRRIRPSALRLRPCNPPRMTFSCITLNVVHRLSPRSS